MDSEHDLNKTNGIHHLIIFSCTLLGYFFVVILFHFIGIEPIYRHITPFYALWKPIYPSFTSSLQLPILILLGMLSILFINKKTIRIIFIFFLSFSLLFSSYIAEKVFSINILLHFSLFFLVVLFSPFLIKILNNENFENIKRIGFVLIGIYFFYVLFSIEVASIRDGLLGIVQPYQRTKYEYIGDIGITNNIYSLFNRYHEIQSYLSLHGRLAPPGPLSLLWFFSYLVGKSPLALSLCTILFGALAIFPLFFWVKEMSNNDNKTALIATFLYTLIPSIVLFCATSTEILYMPFLFLSLWTFDKSLRISSLSLIFLSGIMFAILSLFKFTLLSVGIYFLLRGLLFLYKKEKTFTRLTQLSLYMLTGFLLFYLFLYYFTGYKPISVFLQAQKLFQEDIHALQIIAPRYSLWWFKFFNPLSWAYFTGIPILVGFIGQIGTKNKNERSEFIVFFITFLIFNFAYIAPGEGERSALYVFPFFLVPALQFWQRHFNNIYVFNAVVSFLIFQSILTEVLFYTYW